MNAEQQKRLHELALIMLRDAHGEDFTAEQAAVLPAQIEEYQRLSEAQNILSLLDELKRSYTAFESMSYLAASHAERAQTLLADSFIPGQMHCAKCKFQLTKRVICMGSGTIGAGDNKTEPCPNGCGPLWPVTWKQADQENQEIIGRLCDEQRELRAQLEQLQQDKARLDSGCIITDDRDEFGESYRTEHCGMDLRTRIDEAMAKRAEDLANG
ncbi:hypothetical protein [Pseudomonas sp. C11]|uniref:hypothetical protein n=1 Tax=Pseudomonas sp. C11 TaxID=3075550 RepID=UPI002AFF9598|nr:hypothetical protein [Pseudomonas sp. C11]